MLIPLLILIVAIFIFLLIYRAISQNKISKENELETQKKTAKSNYEFMRNQKKELTEELQEKERQLTTLYNNQEGIKTISIKDLDVEEVDEKEKVGRYLLQGGKITLEQNEKVLQKMELLQMDYLGVCMTLGFIDLETAKKAIKVNKIHTRTIAI
jgi:sortase (surface protein transpeptidase)